MQQQPPRWADRFLRWYCNPELLEEIQGDIYELYDREVAQHNVRRANLRFIWNVFRFFRWSNIKKSNSEYQSNQLGMFKNYLVIGIRNIRKQWSTSLINILGLSIAIGLALTTFIFIDQQLNMDSFHTKRNSIYQIINTVQEGDSDLARWGDSPIVLGPQAKLDHSVIKDFTRIEFRYGNLRRGDYVFNEFMAFVDPSYLKMFDFPIKYGYRSALEEKKNIVIGEETAIKYFGEEDPMGQPMSIKFANGVIQQYVVGAVMDKRPDNASFGYEIMLPMDNFFDLRFNDNYDWAYFTDATFIELQEGADPKALEELLASYKELQNQSDSRWTITDFELISLDGLGTEAFDIQESVASAGHPAGRIALGGLSVILLLLACFNYMNIAVASATKRLKEIALRKVMGSDRRQIIYQFMLENFIQVILAMLIGVLLSYYFLLPGFSYLVPINVPFVFSSWGAMVGFFASLLFVIGVLSGGYPALYISRFQPVSIFRGKEKFGSKSIFSRVLLGFQFFFAFSTIVGSFIFVDNAKFMAERDWGYDPQGVLSIPVANNQEYQKLRKAAAEKPEVLSITGAQTHIARNSTYTTVSNLDADFKAYVYRVGPEYGDLMGLKLKSGRFFEKDKASDMVNGTYVNERFVKELGWDDPIGKTFTYDSSRYNVLGVVEDFHYYTFWVDIEPVFFLMVPEDDYNYLVVKSDPEKLVAVDNYLLSVWPSISPNDPYDKAYQEDAMNGFHEENRANIVIISFIAGLAIVLACLGLFGLLSFNISRRLKEFSVRKVLGAQSVEIIRVAGKEYVWVLTTAFLLGAPAGFFMITQLINMIYPDPKQAGALPFIIAVLIVLVTVVITISGQIIRATRVNPSENLRAE
ncbi:MAG: FtsX-like permease family protein [Cyclobacteriaceae bacterium]